MAKESRTAPIALIGESQGGCVALQVATMYGKNISVIINYAQRYDVTPISRECIVYSFHGGRDRTIHNNISIPSLMNMRIARQDVAATYYHAEVGPALKKFLKKSLLSIFSHVF